MRLQSRRTALCGLMAALSIVLLSAGALVPAALYACPILAMAALLPLRERFGVVPTLTTYAAVSLLAILLVADKELALLYAFFAWYVPVQPRLDNIRPRAVQIAVKLGLANLAAVTLYSLLLFVFQLESVTAELESAGKGLLVALLASANCLFVLTDILLHRLATKWNSRFARHM